VDSSPDAVALARENAERLGPDVVVRADDLDVAAEGWDLVVSNPPYVTPEEWDGLQPEIREWEPRAALVGVGLHERLARIARTNFLVLETHECQARDVAATLMSLGYVEVRVTPDLAGKPRVVEGRRDAWGGAARGATRRASVRHGLRPGRGAARRGVDAEALRAQGPPADAADRAGRGKRRRVARVAARTGHVTCLAPAAGTADARRSESSAPVPLADRHEP